jgi:hypothetical protein
MKPEQWQVLCQAIRDSKLHYLSISSINLETLDTERWQALFSAIKVSQLKTLDLSHNALEKLKPAQWQAFCQDIKNSQLNSLILYYDNSLGNLNPGQLKEFINAIDDNFKLILTINEFQTKSQEIIKIKNRNSTLNKATQLAEKALANNIPNDDTIKAFNELTSAIDLLEGKVTQNANAARDSLVGLQGKLLLQLFQHEYNTSLTVQENPTREEKRSVFFGAMLHLLDDEKHFFKLDPQSQKLFDRILVEVAGIYVPNENYLTDKQRLILLQYAILTHLKKIGELTPISTSSPGLFSSLSLPEIKSLEYLNINDAWQGLAQDQFSLPDELKDIIAATSALALKINELKSETPKQ